MITISVTEPSTIQTPFLIIEKELTILSESTEAIYPIGEAHPNVMQTTSSFPPMVYVMGICMLGSLGVLLYFSISFFGLWRIVRKVSSVKEDEFQLIILPYTVRSFSWWRYIVISEEDYQQNGDTILKHEKMHLRYHHTVDLVWMHLLLIMHWFNPMVWILWRELQELHEYEADEGVISSGVNVVQYQMLLVKKAVGTRLYSMANGFNHSKLKNRIGMMLKKRSNGWVRLRILLAVPVVAGAMYAFAQPKMSEKLNVPATAQAIEEGDLKSLLNFFKEKYEQYSEKHLKRGAYYMIRRSQVSKLYVNANNDVMFNGVSYKAPNSPLSKEIADNLRRRRAADKEETGQDSPQSILLIYDVKSNEEYITKLLQNVKLAYDDLRAEYALTGITNLDDVCPYAVSIDKPRMYGSRGYEITITSADGKQTERIYEVGTNLKHYQQKYGKQATVLMRADSYIEDYIYNDINKRLKAHFNNVKSVREPISRPTPDMQKPASD